MPPALWLIALPVGAAPFVYLFRRVGAGAFAAAVVLLFTAWVAIRAPTGSFLNVLGRTIELDQLSKIALTLLFISTAVLFLISSMSVPFISGFWRKTVDAGVLTGSGRTFYPLSLGLLGFLVAASFSRHLGITAIFIEGAAILGVFIIQGARLESVRAAQRFLVLISLSIPIFLLVSWRIDLYQFSEGIQPARSLQQTALLVGIGFALWLAVVPFHSWVPTTTIESAPTSAAFILIAFPMIAFLTLIELLVTTPWLANSPQLVAAMLAGGAVTAGVGGLWTAVQRSLGGLMGYAALYDLGSTLVILSLGGPAAIPAVLAGLTVRALALTLIAGSVSAIRLHVRGDGFVQIAGSGRQLPVATAGLVIGGLTLAGAPLTAGFAVRWQLLQSVAVVDPRWALLLAVAGLGVAIGYMRGFQALLPRPTDHLVKKQPRRPGQSVNIQESWLLIVTIMILGLACLTLGIFPGLLIAPLREMTANIILPF